MSEISTTWVDSKGREWSNLLDVSLCRKLKTRLRVDLLDDTGSGTTYFPGLLTDTEKLISILWLIAKESGQADAAHVDEAEFESGLNGDSKAAGWASLGEAYAFFCLPPFRAMVCETIELQAEAMAEAVAKSQAMLRGPETKAAISTAIAASTEDIRTQLAALGSVSTT